MQCGCCTQKARSPAARRPPPGPPRPLEGRRAATTRRGSGGGRGRVPGAAVRAPVPSVAYRWEVRTADSAS